MAQFLLLRLNNLTAARATVEPGNVVCVVAAAAAATATKTQNL